MSEMNQGVTELYIAEQHGADRLSREKNRTELCGIKMEMAALKKRLGELETRKAELETVTSRVTRSTEQTSGQVVDPRVPGACAGSDGTRDAGSPQTIQGESASRA
jgi:hypothetical protein